MNTISFEDHQFKQGAMSDGFKNWSKKDAAEASRAASGNQQLQTDFYQRAGSLSQKEDDDLTV